MSPPQLISGTIDVSVVWSIAVNSAGLFVALTWNNSNGNPYYTTSSDGIGWSALSLLSGFTGPYNISGVAVNSSGKFVTVGAYIDIFMASTSTNGTTWTTPTAFGTNGITINSVAVNSSGLFVAVGFDFSGTAYYTTSTTGTSWTAQTGISGLDADLQAIAVSPAGRFVAIGGDFASAVTSRTTFTTSTNGTTWTNIANLSPNYYTMYGIAVNSSGFFVTVGAYYGAGVGMPVPTVITSATGTSWNTPVTLTMASDVLSCRLTSVAVSSTGRFVAVGHGLLLGGVPSMMYATSTNGTTWSVVSPALNTSLASPVNMKIAVSPSKIFAAVGTNENGSITRQISSYGVWP